MIENLIIAFILYWALEEIVTNKKIQNYFATIKYYKKLKSIKIAKKINNKSGKKLLLAAAIFYALLLILNSPEKTLNKLLLEMILLATPISYLIVYSYDKKRNLELVTSLPNAIEILCNNIRVSNNLIKSLAIVTINCKGKLLEILETIYNDLRLGKSINQTLIHNNDGKNIELTIFFIILNSYMQNSQKAIQALYDYADYLEEQRIYKSKIESLLAESSIYYIVICCFPVCIFIMRFILEKEHIIQIYNNPSGHYLLNMVLITNIIAIFIISMAMRGLR